MDKEFVNKNKGLYLEKSKTTDIDWDGTSRYPFFSTDNFPGCNKGWFTYRIDDANNIFIIGSLFYSGNNRESTNNAFGFLKQFAKRKNCNKIKFYTSRNGKIWERRFKDMKITGWRMEVDL